MLIYLYQFSKYVFINNLPVMYFLNQAFSCCHNTFNPFQLLHLKSVTWTSSCFSPNLKKCPPLTDPPISSEWYNVLLFPKETRATLGVGGASVTLSPPPPHPPPRHASCLQLLNGYELSQGITACCHTGAADALIAQWLVGCQQQL